MVFLALLMLPFCFSSQVCNAEYFSPRGKRKCLHKILTPLRYLRAADYCVHRFNGHLLSIRSQEEQSIFNSLVNNAIIPEYNFTIGYHYIDGDLRWAWDDDDDDNPGFSNWEEDDIESNEKKCSTIVCHNNKRCGWRRRRCSMPYPFLCESIKFYRTSIESTPMERGVGVDVILQSISLQDSFVIESEDCPLPWFRRDNGTMRSHIFTVDDLYLCEFEREETPNFIWFKKLFSIKLNEVYVEHFFLTFLAERNIHGFVNSFVFGESKEISIEFLVEIMRVESDFNEPLDDFNLKKNENVYYLVQSNVPLVNEEVYFTVINIFNKKTSKRISLTSYELIPNDQIISNEIESENRQFKYKIQFKVPGGEDDNLGMFNYLYFSFQTYGRKTVQKSFTEKNHPYSFKRIQIVDPDFDYLFVLYILLGVIVVLLAVCCCFASIVCYCFCKYKRKEKKKKSKVVKFDTINNKTTEELRKKTLNRLNLSPAKGSTGKMIKKKLENIFTPKFIKKPSLQNFVNNVTPNISRKLKFFSPRKNEKKE